jgi:hypothetical protein
VPLGSPEFASLSYVFGKAVYRGREKQVRSKFSAADIIEKNSMPTEPRYKFGINGALGLLSTIEWSEYSRAVGDRNVSIVPSDNHAFAPDEVHALEVAYLNACAAVGAAEHSQEFKEKVAIKIVSIAMCGERDATRIYLQFMEKASGEFVQTNIPMQSVEPLK